MNLNNDYPIKRNIEKDCLKKNPVHGERFVRERNLYQWHCVYYIRPVKPFSSKYEKVVVERFFGNEYDRSHKLDCWNWGKGKIAGRHNALPEHLMNK